MQPGAVGGESKGRKSPKKPRYLSIKLSYTLCLEDAFREAEINMRFDVQLQTFLLAQLYDRMASALEVS